LGARGATGAAVRRARALRIASYNIHKGLSFLNRRLVVHELRERLRALAPDIVFLQEVHGEHARRAARFPGWPSVAQYEFLADSVWNDYAYGRNAVYDGGDHGNAILSRFPIARWENEDLSVHRFERRGMLYCEIVPPGWEEPLHCVCVHLGLLGRARRRQLELLRERIERLVPAGATLIVAGDFNDWRQRAPHQLAHPLDLYDAFELARGAPARSFPSAWPLVALDRIYVRGLRVRQAQVLYGRAWARISDHAVLTATLAPA
jgi:endonuclease/exonuclease/phosphatase family metal-dependent hydrolase